MASQPVAENPNRSASIGLGQRLLAILQFLTTNVWFAYGMLFLLQFKVVYGMWFYRDLAYGDTSFYYSYGGIFYHSFLDKIIWSPLYTSFLGILMNFSHDAYVVTTVERLIIIFVVSLLLLALMRRLLPHSIAWLITAWWVILPGNFDALYEVHLFAVIPTLIILLVVLYKPNLWTRGLALGLFLLSAFLMRNELFIATGLWLVICVGWEVYRSRRDGALPALTYARAYVIPIILAFAVVVLFYLRADVQFPELSQKLEIKHTLNVCQIYAYNYQQRHTDWTESPWTQCQDLMMQVFKVPQPSMLEAIERNPRAMAAYFAWNVRLIPDGLQVLLFNATAGTGQPDYIPRITDSTYALVLDILVLVILLVGVIHLRRKDWWNLWIKERAWGWLVLLILALIVAIIMITERPRPSYMFNLLFLILAVLGMCAYAIVERWIGMKRFAMIMPVIAIALIILIPPYFTPDYRNLDTSPNRDLLLRYERLAPFENLFHLSPFTYYLSKGWAGELCNYIAITGCFSVDYDGLMASKPVNVSFADWLTQNKVNLFYVDENVFADPAAQAFLANPQAAGWQVVTRTQTPDSHWELLQRTAAS